MITRRVGNVNVFLMLTEPHPELKKNADKGDVRIVSRGGRTQIACDLNEDETRGEETLYEILPVVSLSSSAKSFCQIQAVEIGGRNIGMVVCDQNGEPRPADWTEGTIAGFRTVHDAIFAVEYSSLRGIGTITSYRLEPEGDKMFLVARRFPGYLKCFGVNGCKGKEVPNLRWSDNMFAWVDEPLRPDAKRRFTEAAMQAWKKSEHQFVRHDCRKNGCGPLYAITEPEAKRAYWERRKVKK